MRIFFLVVVSTLFLLQGCNGVDGDLSSMDIEEKDTRNYCENSDELLSLIDFETIEKGYFPYNLDKLIEQYSIKQRYEIFEKNDRKEDYFKNLFSYLSGNNNSDIDGKVIFTTLGLRHYGGSYIDIEQIEEYDEYIKVKIITESPGDNCLCTTAMEYPYQFVKISNKYKKKIAFCETHIKTICD